MPRITIVRRRKKNSRRRNQNEVDAASFPTGQMIEVEVVRFNKDGTVSVLVEDVNIPESVALSENRRRNRSKAKKKAKNRKRR